MTCRNVVANGIVGNFVTQSLGNAGRRRILTRAIITEEAHMADSSAVVGVTTRGVQCGAYLVLARRRRAATPRGDGDHIERQALCHITAEFSARVRVAPSRGGPKALNPTCPPKRGGKKEWDESARHRAASLRVRFFLLRIRSPSPCWDEDSHARKQKDRGARDATRTEHMSKDVNTHSQRPSQHPRHHL